ncbi:hypothetical protein AB0D71_38255 [Streptomyces avermitilis]|uniref:hypothetical protein n=1 Tax=Streptomyces avermitilis TaxID=33903 RepID=UPI0033F53946
MRHAGITCEWCTQRHPAPVGGEPFGFLRRRHNGGGMYAEDQVEAWLYDTDEYPDHRDRVRYLNTVSKRADAMADIAHWRSVLGRDEDDLSPVLAVVADETFYKHGPDMTEDQEAGFRDSTLEVYDVGILRPYAPPHRRRGQFYAAEETFT